MIRRLAGSPLLRLFSTAVIDQALLSAANFAAGLLLIRYAPVQEYGYFVLAFSSIQLFVSLQNAWVSGPLGVLAPKRSEERRREMIGAVEHSHGRFMLRLVLLLGVVPLAAHGFGLCSLHDALIATATVFAGWMTLRREFMRSMLMIYSRPQAVLLADALYVGMLLALTALAALFSPAAGIYAVLALGLAAALGARKGRGALAHSPGWVAAPAAATWAELRPLGSWGAVAALIYWIYSQSYNFVLASRLDLAAVANVNAARLLLMPMILLMVGVGSLLVPNAAGWLHREGLPRLIRRLWMFLGGLLFLDAVYVLALWWSRDWVTGSVMRRTIPDLDLMLLLWALHCALSTTRDIFQVGLIALERYRPMAWLTATSAIMSLSAMWWGIGHFGAPGALLGTILGETLSLAGVAALLYQSSRRARILAAPA